MLAKHSNHLLPPSNGIRALKKFASTTGVVDLNQNDSNSNEKPSLMRTLTKVKFDENTMQQAKRSVNASASTFCMKQIEEKIKIQNQNITHVSTNSVSSKIGSYLITSKKLNADT